jgi:hypothetical protein
MIRRLLNLLTACVATFVASCQSPSWIRLEVSPFFNPEVLYRLNDEATRYRRDYGRWPARGADLPNDSVERLGPLPPNLQLEFVRFSPAPDGGVAIEWRPKGRSRKWEWMWAKFEGDSLLTSVGSYPKSHNDKS